MNSRDHHMLPLHTLPPNPGAVYLIWAKKSCLKKGFGFGNYPDSGKPFLKQLFFFTLPQSRHPQADSFITYRIHSVCKISVEDNISLLYVKTEPNSSHLFTHSHKMMGRISNELYPQSSVTAGSSRHGS